MATNMEGQCLMNMNGKCLPNSRIKEYILDFYYYLGEISNSYYIHHILFSFSFVFKLSISLCEKGNIFCLELKIIYVQGPAFRSAATNDSQTNDTDPSTETQVRIIYNQRYSKKSSKLMFNILQYAESIIRNLMIGPFPSIWLYLTYLKAKQFKLSQQVCIFLSNCLSYVQQSIVVHTIINIFFQSSSVIVFTI